MARIMNDTGLKTMLVEAFSTMRHLTICSTVPATASCAWIHNKSSGRSRARYTTASNMFNAPGSTTVGWTIASCSAVNIAVTSSGNAEHVCFLGGTATAAIMFCTVCTTRALTTSDTVSVPSFNIRIGDPVAS